MFKFDLLKLKGDHIGRLFLLKGKILMTKKLEIVHLNRKYFEENSHFINMLDDGNILKQVKRPYVYVKVRVSEKDFLLPLRSNLNHPNGFHAPSSKSANAGIDYSHALLLPDESYIKKRSHLDKEQYDYVQANYETIKKGFSLYLKDYIRESRKGIAHKLGRFKNSTLLNFNQELEVVKKLEKTKRKNKKEIQDATVEQNKVKIREKVAVQDKVGVQEGTGEQNKVKMREKVAVINRAGVQETPGKQDEVKVQKKTKGQDQDENRDEQKKRARRLAYMRQMGRER